MGSCIEYLQTCPAQNDGDVQLLGKILQVLNSGSGGGGAGVSGIKINGGPTQSGLVNLTIPSNTDELPEGATNLYFTEPRTLATDLTGFASALGAITAADTILSAFGKTQGRLAALETGAAGPFLLRAGDTGTGAFLFTPSANDVVPLTLTSTAGSLTTSNAFLAKYGAAELVSLRNDGRFMLTGRIAGTTTSALGNVLNASDTSLDTAALVAHLGHQLGNVTANNMTTWTSRAAAVDNEWRGVTYGAGRFVAVSSTGTGNRVMTSLDGTNWVSRVSAGDLTWRDVTFAAGIFVAVANDGGANTVMTSPDGVVWTTRTSLANTWFAVTFGVGLFVAVSTTGGGDRVMTSPDGITWTSRTSAADNQWSAITFGNGLFVASAVTGTNDRVMTSPDGITWTTRVTTNSAFQGAAFGNNIFVIVATDGAIMSSPDGITWTSRTGTGVSYQRVAFGNGFFVAVANSGTGTRVATSPDGITWTARTSAADNDWRGVVFGNAIWVAVGRTGTGNRVMTSPTGTAAPGIGINIDQSLDSDTTVLTRATRWTTDWSTVTHADRTARTTFYGFVNGTETSQLILGNNQAQFNMGSAAFPAVSSRNAPGNGLFFPTAINTSLSVSGVESVRLSIGSLILGTSTTAQSLIVNETTDSTLTNYSRLVLVASAGTNHLVRTQSLGTGTLRILQVGTGPSAGTNIAGVNVIFHSGQPTGNAAPGAILFQQGLPAGASGASVTALATIWQITTAGILAGAAGRAFSTASGTNQRAGNATLVGGTVTVANTSVTANTVVLLTRKTSGGTIGLAITYTITAATSFTITSDSAIDTSTFSYFLIEVP